jgi:hypothetical protein
MARLTCVLLLAILGGLTTNTTQAQESMERGLLKRAPGLIKAFKEKHYKNVGVLKFLVSREGEAFRDNVGTINLLMARQLETSLLLANDVREPLGIIQNASEVARTIEGAGHLSKEGREKLFTGKYPLAWGKEGVSADAFLTGAAEISKDLKRITISLLAFDKYDNKLTPVCDDFVVANAANRLGEMGESFVLRDISRGAFDEGEVMQEAVKVHDKTNNHPAALAGTPVTLEVYYDNKKIPLEFRNGKAYIPEPNEGQSVHFRLSRDGSQERFAVVLKVNGENTLDKQRMPDFECSKWVLAPKGGPWEIHGYQIGSEVRERFRVASIAESKAREVNYGSDVGTITMTVFREQRTRPKPKLLTDEEQAVKIIAKANELKVRPKNFSALKAKLIEDANSDSARGLIVEGAKERFNVESTTFHADPIPVMCWTIVYYQKKS